MVGRSTADRRGFKLQLHLWRWALFHYSGHGRWFDPVRKHTESTRQHLRCGRHFRCHHSSFPDPRSFLHRQRRCTGHSPHATRGQFRIAQRHLRSPSQCGSRRCFRQWTQLHLDIGRRWHDRKRRQSSACQFDGAWCIQLHAGPHIVQWLFRFAHRKRHPSRSPHRQFQCGRCMPRHSNGARWFSFLNRGYVGWSHRRICVDT